MANDSNMVKVTLRRSVGVRNPGTGGGATLYGPGTVSVPRDVARTLGLDRKRAGSRTRSVAPTTESTTATSEDPYTGWLKSDFQAEAERRGLDVKRTDGGDGDLRVEDYRAALEADDASKQ